MSSCIRIQRSHKTVITGSIALPFKMTVQAAKQAYGFALPRRLSRWPLLHRVHMQHLQFLGREQLVSRSRRADYVTHIKRTSSFLQSI